MSLGMESLLAFLIALSAICAGCIAQALSNHRKRQASADRFTTLDRLADWQRQQAEEQAAASEEAQIEREAALLSKREQRAADLQYKVKQADADIEHWTGTAASLHALLDLEEAELAGTVVGSRRQAQVQKRVITLANQIHAAEARLHKAQHIKAAASKELAL